MLHLVTGIVHLVTDREDRSGEPGNGLSVLMQGFIRNLQKAYRLQEMIWLPGGFAGRLQEIYRLM